MSIQVKPYGLLCKSEVRRELGRAGAQKMSEFSFDTAANSMKRGRFKARGVTRTRLHRCDAGVYSINRRECTGVSGFRRLRKYRISRYREAMLMTPIQIVAVVIIMIVVVAVAVALILQNRSKKLRAQFGPQYDRTVAQTGTKFKAEAELERVVNRVKGYDLRALTAADRDRFQQSWRVIQAKFVDDPTVAFLEADQILGAVMSAPGYPPSDFEHRVTEISVDHSLVAENYRAGHEIAVRHSQQQSTTEDLRKGMVHYRTLFEELMRDEAVPLRSMAVGQR